jgi:hypothetical protein
MKARDRIKQILQNCCGGGWSMAADQIDAEFVVIHRDELPPVYKSAFGNGFTTALAQERHQPALDFSAEDGDKPGEWNRKIAYANLAVADAIEYRLAAESEENLQQLRAEAYELYRVSCLATDTVPAPDWNTAIEGRDVARDFLAIATRARELHGISK